MGFAIPAAAEMENGRAILSFGSAGAILGTLATIGILKQRRG